MATQQISSSAPTRRYQFSAAARGPMAGFARLSLYDGRMQLIADGYERISSSLTAGLYKVTLKLNEGYKEAYITVQSDQAIQLEVPETASSVIAKGFNTSHEYYTNDAEHYSSETTAVLAGIPQGNGALFLFFRYPDERTYIRYKEEGRRLSDHFQLLDSQRRVISTFGASEVKEEYTRFGWMAFHARLAPGSYYLHFAGRSRVAAWKEDKGQASREIPVQVFNGWQTQGFLTFRNGPVFSSMIFSLSSLNTLDRLNLQVQDELVMLEGVLRKFANGIYYLPPDMRQSLAAGKFGNPFLGIAAAYAYFKSTSNDQEAFFNTVMLNLSNLLGTEAPDMQLLATLAAGHYSNLPVPQSTLQVPGMFAAGFSLVLRQQASSDALRIGPGSVAEKCLDRLYHDMLWTSYQPFAKPKQGPGSPPVQAVIDGQRSLQTRLSKSLLTESLANDFDLEIRAQSPSKLRKPAVLNSWMAHSLADALGTTPQGQFPALDTLAASLQITPNLLMETAGKVSKSSEKITAYLSQQPDPELAELFNTENLQRISLLAGRRHLT
ncbi:hypothetical protein [Mucilaginibacter flavus]|uniref:hypothetical protein n=1 Tax=Mucilaginibacter flavus TaxID=931504 RepID=UPI0025B4D9E1|nr:hypothetical protein [Mucilaginibacter flavus]MDN3583846.1 hypothetical protein [Mucilaginibacter flavus]